MPGESSEARDRITVSMQAHHTLEERSAAWGVFTVTCYDAAGRLIWQEETARAVIDHREPINP